MSENFEHKEHTGELTFKQFLLAIRKPIFVATLINAICSFLPISVIVTLRINSWVPAIFNIIVLTVCLVWSGKKSYRNFKPTIVHASFAGPILLFVAYFLVDLVLKIPYMFETWEPPAKFAGTLFGNPFFITLISLFSGYLMFFSVAMGLSALGATLEKRNKKQKPSNHLINRTENTSALN